MSEAASSKPPAFARLLLRPWFAVAAILLISFGIFAGQLDNGFTNWDDNWLITENFRVQEASVSNLADILNPWASRQAREALGNEYLPLRDLSYLLNFSINDLMRSLGADIQRDDPFNFQLLNLLLHAAIGVMVWHLARKLSGDRLLALVSGLVFATMPIHVESVAWLSSRKELLSAFFVMLSVILWLRWRQRPSGQRQAIDAEVGGGSKIALIGSYLAFVAAVLSKTPALILPGLLIAVEVFGRGRLRPMALGGKAVVIGGFFATAILIFSTISYPIANNGLLRGAYGDDRVASTLTALSAMGRYFLAFLAGAPVGPAIDYELRPTLDINVVAGGGILLLAIGYCVFGTWRCLTGRSGAGMQTLGAMRLATCNTDTPCGKLAHWSAFGLTWLLIAFVPVSNILVMISTVYADRYGYVPSIGWALAVGALVAAGVQFATEQKRRSVVVGIGVAMVALLGWYSVASYGQVEDWRNSDALWRRALSIDPDNHTALFNQGRTHQEHVQRARTTTEVRNHLTSARESYTKALSTPARTFRWDPARLHIALAQVAIELEDLRAAQSHIAAAREAIPQPWRIERDVRRLTADILNEEGRLASVQARGFHKSGRADLALEAENRAKEAFNSAASVDTEEPGAALLNAALLEAEEASREARKVGKFNQTARDGFERALAKLETYAQRRGRQDDVLLANRAKILVLFGEAVEGPSAKVPPPEARELYQKGIAEYQELIRRLDGMATSRRQELLNALMELAESQQRLPGSEGEAIATLERASKLDESVKADAFRARLLLRIGRQKEGIALVREVIARDAQFQPARQELAAITASTGAGLLAKLRKDWTPEYLAGLKAREKPVPESIDDDVLIAAFADRKEFADQFAFVLESYRTAARLTPEDEQMRASVATFLLAVGRGLWRKGDATAAEEILRESFTLNEEQPETSELLGSIYFRWMEDLVARHRSTLESLAADAPRPAILDEVERDIWALLRNFLILSEAARRQFALRVMREANKLRSSIENTYFDRNAVNIGALDTVTGGEQSVLREGKTIEGYKTEMRPIVQMYEIARAMDNQLPDPLTQLNDYYQKAQDFERAVQAFRDLIATLKDDRGYRQQVQQSLAINLTQWGHSLKVAFKRAARSNKDAEAVALRKQAYDVYYEAAEAWRTAIELAPIGVSHQTLQSIGLVYQELGLLDLSRAEDYLRSALGWYDREPEMFGIERVSIHRKLAIHVANDEQRIFELQQAIKVLDRDDVAADSDIRVAINQQIADIQARASVREAERILEGGDAAAALKLMDERNAPASPSAARVRALALEAVGQPLEAAAVLLPFKLAPALQLQAGRLLLKHGANTDLRRAAEALKQARDLLNEERADALYSGRAVEAINGRLAECEALLKGMSERSRAKVEEAAALPVIDFGHRKRLYREAIDLAPDNYTAFEGYARACTGLGRLALRAAEMQEEDGAHDLAASSRGAAAEDFEEAYTTWTHVIGVYPSFRGRYIESAVKLALDEWLPLTERSVQTRMRGDLEIYLNLWLKDLEVDPSAEATLARLRAEALLKRLRE